MGLSDTTYARVSRTLALLVRRAQSTWGDSPENYTELAMALSVLGAGAVGIGDYIGASNVSLIMTCAMSDGTLLSPSRPSTYVRATRLGCR